jgi:hypothetical protein
MDSPHRPRSVVLALRALWALSALTFVELALVFLDPADDDAGIRWLLVGIVGIFTLFFALPLYFLGKRHKWALYTVVLISIAWVAAGYFTPETSYVGWSMWVSHVAYSTLEIIGLALLATKESQAWFFRHSSTQGAF